MPPGIPNNTSESKYLSALFLIVIAGSTLRIYGLDTKSLWADELATWFFSIDLNNFWSTDDVHPPLYPIFMHLFIGFFGESEFALRLPSTIAGILSIPATYALGIKLYSRKEGIVAAMLMAVLQFPIWYSQEARANAILLLLCMMAFFYWIDLVRSIHYNKAFSRKSVIAYIALSLLASYFHFFGFYFSGILGLYMLAMVIRKPASYLRILKIYIPFLIFYSPAIYFLLEASAVASSMNFSPPFKYYLSIEFFGSALNSSYVLLILSALACGKGLLYSFKNGTFRSFVSPDVILVSYIALSFGVIFLVFLSIGPIPYMQASRHFIFVLPALYLLISRGLITIPIVRNNIFPTTFVLAVLLVTHLVFGTNYQDPASKEQFRQAARVATVQNPSTSECIVITNARYDAYQYYFNHFGDDRTVYRISDLKKLLELLKSVKSDCFWVLDGHHPIPPKFIESLQEHFVLISEDNFFLANAMFFRKKDS